MKAIKLVLLFFLVMSMFIVLNKEKLKTLIVLSEDSGKKNEYKNVTDKIMSVAPGMTKEEVKVIMGDPIEVYLSEEKGIYLENWVFEHSKLASEAPRCLFDKENGLVVKVVIGDGEYKKTQ